MTVVRFRRRGFCFLLLSFIFSSTSLLAEEVSLKSYLGKKGEILRLYENTEKRDEAAKQLAKDLYEVRAKGEALEFDVSFAELKKSKERQKRMILLDFYLNRFLGEHNGQFSVRLDYIPLSRVHVKDEPILTKDAQNTEGLAAKKLLKKKYDRFEENIRVYFFDRSMSEAERFLQLTRFITSERMGQKHPKETKINAPADRYLEFGVALKDYLMKLKQVGKLKDPEISRRVRVLEAQFGSLIDHFNENLNGLKRTVLMTTTALITGLLVMSVRGERVLTGFRRLSFRVPEAHAGKLGLGLGALLGYGIYRTEKGIFATGEIHALSENEAFILKENEILDVFESAGD